MNATVELNLALILFLPWFAILGTLFWWFPRAPRTPARRWFDIAALSLSVAAFVASAYWAQAIADPDYGRIWKQVLATAIGYGVFLAVLGVAFGVRRHIFGTARRR